MENLFSQIGEAIGQVVQEKNIAYGDSFRLSAEVLKIIFPQGVKPQQYQDFLAITRVIDKLFRIANRKEAFGENPWADITGYGILSLSNDKKTLDKLFGG